MNQTAGMEPLDWLLLTGKEAISAAAAAGARAGLKSPSAPSRKAQWEAGPPVTASWWFIGEEAFMYIYLTDRNTVAERIPDENPVFPGIPVERRYAPDFARRLLYVPDDAGVEENWIYDPESGAFSPPPAPEPPETGPEPEDPGPALSQRVERLEAETAALAAAVERGLHL